MKALLLVLFAIVALAQQAGKPETVMVTCLAKHGSEAELARVLARHWTTARELKLVLDAPHLTLRRTETGGRVSFVEIFTWRDASIPDNAPPAIQAIWTEMNKLADKIDIDEVEIIGPSTARASAAPSPALAPGR
jgi:hypothetical protein